MKNLFLASVVILFSTSVNAQFLKKLGDKAAQAAGKTVERKVEEKSENSTGKALDKVLNTKKSTASSEESSAQNSSKTDKKSKAASKIQEVKSAKDFVQGDKLLVFEDFAQDAIGDFPVNWLTNSSGEIVTIASDHKKWLKLSNKGAFTITDVTHLPENFTLEFDLFVNKESFSFYSSALNFGFIETKKKNDYTKWDEYSNGKEGVILRLLPTVADVYQEGKLGRAAVKIYSDGEKIITNELDTPTFNYTNNNKVKVQIWRQKNRLRMYVGDKKVWDLPKAFQDVKYNSILFYVHDYNNDNDKYFISNFRLAEATADSRHKLLETGTFSTNEILFDTGSAIIKPSSSKVLDDIGLVLKENPTLKVSITGHTDSDGDNKKNLILSEQRAMAVKTELVRKFNLNEDMISVVGLGESEPIAKNDTDDGKLKNRRVEFKIIK